MSYTECFANKDEYRKREGKFYGLSRSKMFICTQRATCFGTERCLFEYKMWTPVAIKEVVYLSNYAHYKICWSWFPWHSTHVSLIGLWVGKHQACSWPVDRYFVLSATNPLQKILFSGIHHSLQMNTWIKSLRGEIWRPRWPWNGTTASYPVLWVHCAWEIP